MNGTIHHGNEHHKHSNGCAKNLNGLTKGIVEKLSDVTHHHDNPNENHNHPDHPLLHLPHQSNNGVTNKDFSSSQVEDRHYHHQPTCSLNVCVVLNSCHVSSITVIHSFSHSLLSLILSFTHSVIHSFCHSLILSFTHSVIHSFCHSLISFILFVTFLSSTTFVTHNYTIHSLYPHTILTTPSLHHSPHPPVMSTTPNHIQPQPHLITPNHI